jgi:hypothetical protein
LSQKAIDNFVTDYCDSVDELLAHDTPYHEQWCQFLRPEAIFDSNYHCPSIAIALAEEIDEQSPKLADYLKVEIVDEMLRQISTKQPAEVVDKVRAILKRWVESPVERIWLTGEATA